MDVMEANPMLGEAELCDSRRSLLGEGPLWHAEGHRVFWVDILGKLVLWADLRNGDAGEFNMPSHIGAVLPRENGRWWAFLVDGVYDFDVETTHIRKVASFPHLLGPEALMTRANDAAVGPGGEVFCGTMAYDPGEHPGAGNLYTFDGATLTSVVDNVTISNGLGWSADSSRMFYVDTTTQQIDQFSYGQGGALSDRRRFATIPQSLGSPDGLAVDSADHVWVALWGGGRVQRLAPDGSLAGYIQLPCAHVTSCAFSGEDLQDLIITTAAVEDEDNDAAGKLYSFRTSTPGLPAFTAHR
jgi:sugar lactone lactonase YvrE